MVRRLSAFFDIQPAEQRIVGLIFALYFCLGTSFLLTQTAGYAIFLDIYGSHALPYTYIGIAIGVSVLAFTYLRLSDHLTIKKLLLVNLGFLFTVSIVLRIGLAVTQAPWLAFVLPIWEFALTNLGNIIIWSLVGCLFDVRQSKRLFGLVSSGRWFAATLVGLLIPLLVEWLGTANLLWAAAFSLGVGLLLLIRILREQPRAFTRTTQETEAVPTIKASESLLKNPFVLLIFFEAFIWVLAFFIGDNIYYIETERQYTNADQLASVLGLISAAIGALTLVGNLFMSGRIISRYGVGAGVLLTPVVNQVIMLGFVLVGTFLSAPLVLFGLAVLAKIANSFMSMTFEVASLRILYQPLPTAQRVRISAISDGIIEPLAIGAAGVLLAVLIDVFNLDSLSLAYLFLVVGIGWIGASWILARRYPDILSQALTTHRLGKSVPLTIDASTVNIVKPFLNDPRPEAVLYTLDILEQSDENRVVREALPGLLEHRSVKVRLAALERIEQLKLGAALTSVRYLVQTEPDVHVREYALRALTALDGQKALEIAARHMDAPETPVRRGALVGLLRYGGPQAKAQAEDRLMQLVESGTPDNRELAAQILKETGQRHHTPLLLKLLGSTSPKVRLAALSAVQQLNDPQVWPLVVQAVTDPTTRSQAITALIAGGSASMPSIRSAVESVQTPREVMMALARVCGKIGGHEALNTLRLLITAPDPEVRTASLAGLSACGYRSDEREAILDLVHEEANTFTTLLAIRRDLSSSEEVTLLNTALDKLMLLAQERMLYLLSFIYDAEPVNRAREALMLGWEQLRAMSLEILETYSDRQMRAFLIPIFDGSSPGEQLKRLSVIFPQTSVGRETRLIEVLAHPPTPWVRICALYAVGRLQLEHARPFLPGALDATNPLLKETAYWTKTRLDRVPISGGIPMLSTIEKVIILKTVSIFAETPDEVLAEVATLLEEVHCPIGTRIFDKGDLGNSLYIVVSGKVRIHDGDVTINALGARHVFGEMALLDPAPRIASVTSVEDTHLFRLGQEAFFELVDSRGEVARGIIRVLTGYLRTWVENADLRLIQQSMAKTVPIRMSQQKTIS